jgi:hypothetical protein
MTWKVFCSLIAIGGLAAISLSTKPDAHASVVAVALSTVKSDDCNLWCSDEPFYCTAYEHDAWWDTEPNAEWGEGRHALGSECWPGICDEKHPPCGGGELLHGRC